MNTRSVVLAGFAVLMVAGFASAAPGPGDARSTPAPGAGAKSGAPDGAAVISYSALPPQAADTPFPTRIWQREPLRGALLAHVDEFARKQFEPAAGSAVGRVNAVVLVQRGRLVYERYRDGHRCDQVEHTMSVAKTMGAAIAGLLVRDGKLQLDAPLDFAQWPRGDPRRAITARMLLNMTSGLRWTEPGDFLEFAFGRAALDLVTFAASRPLAHPPGVHFQYSDGTPSLIGELLRRSAGGTRAAAAAYVRTELLEPLGMTRTELEFDRVGNWYGSSGVRWSPCDLARFGLLLARDGVWEGRRLLPEAWVNAMRTPTEASMSAVLPPGAPPDALEPYGLFADVYLRPEAVAARKRATLAVDAFGHYGFGGSHLRIVPSRDLVVVIVGERGREPWSMLETFRMTQQLSDEFPRLEPPAGVTP